MIESITMRGYNRANLSRSWKLTATYMQVLYWMLSVCYETYRAFVYIGPKILVMKLPSVSIQFYNRLHNIKEPYSLVRMWDLSMYLFHC